MGQTNSWAPRSSTLPRRLTRPTSSSPTPTEIPPCYRPQSASPSKFLVERPLSVSPLPPQYPKSHSPHPSSTSPCPHSLSSSHHSTSNMIRTMSPTHHPPMYSHRPKSTSPSPHTTPIHRSRKPYIHNSGQGIYVDSNGTNIVNPANLPPAPPPRDNHYPKPNDIHSSNVYLQSTNRSPIRISDQSPNPVNSKSLYKRHVSLNKTIVSGHRDVSQIKPRSRSLTPGRNFSKNSSKPHDNQINCYQDKSDKDKKQKTMDDKRSDAINKTSYDRSSLQLDLNTVHMNNTKAIVSSPQRPYGLKNNDLHNDLVNITKESSSDVTARNLGYIETEKCDKKMYANDHSKISSQNQDKKPNLISQSSTTGTESTTSTEDDLKKTEIQLEINTNSNHNLNNIKDPDTLNDNKEKLKKPGEDAISIKTYPSLSDLDLKFSSFTAQKILQGVSMNSIDTLLEVNLVAEKHKRKLSKPVTNTDFGFV